MIEKKKYELYLKILDSMKNNTRPSLNGKALTSIDINNFGLNDFENLSKHDNNIAKDYLLKTDGTYRNNAYIISPYILGLINYYSLLLKQEFGSRENTYYSGRFEKFDFFYKNSYEYFQKILILNYESYNNFIKIDLKDFYGNISLKNLKSFEYPNLNKIIDIIAFLNISEFPIIQDCAGLSYIATCIILKNMDIELEEMFNTKLEDYHMIRYSDDLYVLYNGVIDENKIKEEIHQIVNKNGFSINYSKYINKPCEELPNFLYQQMYDIIVNGKQIDVYNLLGEDRQIIERIKNYLDGLKGIDSLEKYKLHSEISFSIIIDAAKNFKKNVFDEILYTKRMSIAFSNIEVIEIMKTIDIYNKIEYDPKRLTLIILFCKDANIIKKFLHNLYSKLEKENESKSDMLCLLTYLSQRDCRESTLRKIKEKLKKRYEHLECYLNDYIKSF